MLKVLYFITSLNIGGAETLVKDYVLNLNPDKFDVQILCLYRSKNPMYENLLENENIKVTYISKDYGYSEEKAFERCIKKIHRYKRVKEEIHKIKPDILHSHLLLNSYVKYSRPNKDTKLFYTIHSDPKRYWGINDNESILVKYNKRKEFKAIEWLIRKYKMRLIVLHEQMKIEANKLFNVDNSIVLNNGINFSRFTNEKSKLQIKNELNLPRDSFVVGHIGRFIEEKNHLFLIDIFMKVLKERDDAILLLIGEGEKKNEILEVVRRNNIEKNVIILSNRLDIPEILMCFDVFVFPSKVEGLPIVLIEAQKVGVRCVISDNIPYSAIVSNLVNVLSLNDSTQLWANEVSKNERVSIEYYGIEDWNIKKIIEKLEKIYEI